MLLLLVLLVNTVVVPELPAGEGCVVGGLRVLCTGVWRRNRRCVPAVLDHFLWRVGGTLLLFVASRLLVLLRVVIDGQHWWNVVVTLETLNTGHYLTTGFECSAGGYCSGAA